jgi:pimeloyl-ACP methyl ester carboxylesterase
VNVEPLLPRIAAPVLALFPEAGRIATTEQEATLRRLIPDVHTVRMNTPYHMVQFMQPAACAEQVLRFLLLQDGVAA